MSSKSKAQWQRVGLALALGLVLIGLLLYQLYYRLPRGPTLVKLSDPAVQEEIRRNREKVLVIGVDGATWEIIFSLIGQGRMPNLASLLEHGGRGVLESIPPLISPALWTTIATGQPREVHGITNFLTKQPFEYNPVRMASSLRRVPALWEILAGQGKKVAVVNWYAAYPAEVLPAGVFVAEGISPERINPTYIQPAAWVERIQAIQPLRDPELESKLAAWDHPVPARAYELDRLVASISLEILRQEQPQAMFVYFQHLDVISHGFWKYRRPQGLEYRYPLAPGERERFGDAIESYYQYTDRLIGELTRAAAGYTVLVVSDHGFAATYPPKSIFVSLDQLLERLGYLAFDGPTCDDLIYALVREGAVRIPAPQAAGVFSLCQDLEPFAKTQGAPGVAGELLRRRLMDRRDLEPVLDKITELAELLARGHTREKVDWHRTRVFNLEDFHDPVQGLYLNLKNREPEGVVPEDQFERFRDEVIRELKRLHSEDGRPAFRMVKANPNKRKLPIGPEDPPDILVEFNREILGREHLLRDRDDQDPLPLAAVLWSYSDVSGDHTPQGIWLVSGPGVAGFEPLPAGILDITPTVLWLFGFPKGADMPGRVLTSAFAGEVKKSPVRYLQSWTPLVPARVQGGGAPLSEEKRDQFKALGYIQK